MNITLGKDMLRDIALAEEVMYPNKTVILNNKATIPAQSNGDWQKKEANKPDNSWKLDISDIAEWFKNGTAGLGDSVSFGLTEVARNELGAGKYVDKNSIAYKIGDGVGTIVGLGKFAKAAKLIFKLRKDAAKAFNNGNHALATRLNKEAIYNVDKTARNILEEKGKSDIVSMYIKQQEKKERSGF